MHRGSIANNYHSDSQSELFTKNNMKVIICGSRSLTELRYAVAAVKESGFNIEEVISGAARGIDTLAKEYASINGLDLTVMYPNWAKRGRSAGYHRNTRMLKYADAVIAIWDGSSKGTNHTISEAKKMGLQVYIKTIKV